jgi:diguanylate cyclase (GGDEF)-like protein/PAS domain S-box-containing protein
VNRWGPAIRISLALVALTSCILVLGDLAGLTPGRSKAAVDARRQICETLAVHVARDAQRGDFATIRSTIELLRERDPDLLSFALRRADGTILVQVGDHAALWEPSPDGSSTPTHAQVPILRGNETWGTVEVSFTPLAREGLIGLLENPLGRLLTFVSALGSAVYFVYMRRTLRHLDPSSVIPMRVRAVLDTLAEGVILLDRDERIVLANESFARLLASHSDALIGTRASDLPWHGLGHASVSRSKLPWIRALDSGERQTGYLLELDTGANGLRRFSANGSVILDEAGNRRGALATFDDVTRLEQASEKLRDANDALLKQQEEIQLQNNELQILATTDPLTGCLNRRSFLECFEREYASGQTHPRLHCLMVDIDHFKRVNDNFGHAVGDSVIALVAKIIGALTRPGDAICRWGGEEFCLLLLNRDEDEAEALAQLARQRIAAIDREIENLPATLELRASFGLSSKAGGGVSPVELIDQADRALYASKAAGRDRVTVFHPSIVQ